MSNTLIAWLDAKKKLDEAKAAEATLRDALMANYHDAAIEAGTENVPVNGGNLKIINALDYKFIDPEHMTPRDPQKDLRSAASKMLNELVNFIGEGGGFIADRLVKWVPEISVSEYKKLTPEQRKIVDTVLETKPKSPQVSWEADNKKG